MLGNLFNIMQVTERLGERLQNINLWKFELEKTIRYIITKLLWLITEKDNENILQVQTVCFFLFCFLFLANFYNSDVRLQSQKSVNFEIIQIYDWLFKKLMYIKSCVFKESHDT